MLKVKLTIAEQESMDDHLHESQPQHTTIIEFDDILVITQPLHRVHSEFNLWFDLPEGLVTPSMHHVGRYRWMMANLLKPNRASVNPALESFSQQRVKRLFHADPNNSNCHKVDYSPLHRFERIRCKCSLQ